MVEKFCENLKELRTMRRMTQKQVAEKINVAVSTYANWEQGRTQPNIADIYGLLAAFEIDANELFDIK